MINIIFIIVITVITFITFPPAALAHAFGQQYNLPVPVWLYLYGGAAAIIVSFIVLGVFLNQPKKDLTFPSKLLFHLPSSKFKFLKYISLLLFLFTIAAGLFGINDSLLNFNMTFFWIIFFLGLTYLTGLFGNLWAIINPWKTLIELFEKVTNSQFKPLITYPTKLTYLPALIGYFLLIWTELVSRVTPYTLSLRIIIFTILSFIFTFLFGKEIWLEYFDFFSLFFKLLSKVSPFEYRDNKLYLRPPFIGLIKERSRSLWEVLFVLFMLSSTAFDGFHSTTAWFRIELNYLVDLEQRLGEIGFPLIQTLALILSLIAFYIIFIIVITVIKVTVRSPKSVRDLALDFGYSLVPIAFVYNIAHYYTLLLIQGQSIISLISDPFGFGWNLFGTANFIPNIGLIGAKFIWNSEVAVIILGHIAGIYLAHMVALKVFPSHKKAVISQFPMLLLMVCYTVAGLWILSQPFSTGG